MTNPLHVVQSMLVRCNANFLDMRDGILVWEATHTLKNYPLNLRVIGIREVKDVIHPLMKHLHATLVIVGIYVCTCLLVLLVAHISAGVSGACRPGPDIIICSYGTELARVNRTFVLARIET